MSKKENHKQKNSTSSNKNNMKFKKWFNKNISMILVIILSIFLISLLPILLYIDNMLHEMTHEKYLESFEKEVIEAKEPYYAAITDELNSNPELYSDKKIYIEGTVVHPSPIEGEGDTELLNKMLYVGIKHYWSNYDEYNMPGLNCYFKTDIDGNIIDDNAKIKNILKENMWIEATGVLKQLTINGEPYTYLDIEEYKAYKDDQKANYIVQR